MRTCGILQSITENEEIYSIKRVRGKLVMGGSCIKIWENSSIYASEPMGSIRCLETSSDESVLFSSCGDGSISVIYN